MTENNESEDQTESAPPKQLVIYVITTSVVSAIAFFLVLTYMLIINDMGDSKTVIKILTIAMMLIAGVVGGCLSNLRRIVKHSAPGNFDTNHCLSYYLRPLFGGLAGIVVFFLLLGGAITFSGGTPIELKDPVPLSNLAPYVIAALLAGFGATEFCNKLTDLADSLFAISRK